MNLSNDAFSMPLEDTPGSLFGDVAKFPNVCTPGTLKSAAPSRAALAKWCGYATECEFLKESRQVATVGANPWFATCDKIRGGWVMWRNPPTPLGHS